MLSSVLVLCWGRPRGEGLLCYGGRGVPKIGYLLGVLVIREPDYLGLYFFCLRTQNRRTMNKYNPYFTLTRNHIFMLGGGGFLSKM